MKGLRLPTSAKLSLATLSSALLSLSMPAVVDAQDERLEEITVTGSRIVRRDFEANSPILTVEEEAFDNTMSVGIETVMNQCRNSCRPLRRSRPTCKRARRTLRVLRP
jgi:hypothetical protein